MIDHRTDRELVAAHLSGDRAALAAIYDRYADPLYDTAAAMLGDRHEAEDLTHDVFVVASRKLVQLREPERLKAWLFAVLRHEVYRRAGKRSKVRATDLTASGMPEMSATHDPNSEGAEIERAELANFVREAAGGLGERDQLLLELSARQGLAGADLADAIGVSQQQCHVLLHRMRERVQRSIGALTVARYGRNDCPDLQALLSTWNGVFDELTRKRIAGHVDECEICGETSRKWAVVPLFSAAPALAAPLALRDRVLASTASDAAVESSEAYHFDTSNGFPVAANPARKLAVLIAMVIALLVLFGGTLFVIADGDDTPLASESTIGSEPTASTALAAPATTTLPTTTSGSTTTSIASSTSSSSSSSTSTSSSSTSSTSSSSTSSRSSSSSTSPPPTTTSTTVPTAPPPPPPVPAGQLVLSAGTIDLGANLANGSIDLANAGGQPLDWSIGGTAAPFIWSTTAGTLQPGATFEVQLGIDRTGLPEGDIVRSFVVVSSAEGSTQLTALASVEHAPTVTIVGTSSSVQCPTLSGPITVSVADESAISGVVLSWTGPGAAGSTAMTRSGANWTGNLTPQGVNGTWAWVATATDVRGNTGTAGAPFIVFGC